MLLSLNYLCVIDKLTSKNWLEGGSKSLLCLLGRPSATQGALWCFGGLSNKKINFKEIITSWIVSVSCVGFEQFLCVQFYFTEAV